MTATLKIGDKEFPLDGVTWERGDDRVDAAPLGLLSPPKPIEFTTTIAAGEFDVAAFRAPWADLTPPRHTLTLTSRRRDGSTFTETIEVDEIRIVRAYPRRKRPGQWTDATRGKRHRRLVRAAERRAGISRRGLRRGFPIAPYVPLSEIHAKCKHAMVEADARLLEQVVNAGLRERWGTAAPTMRFEVDQ